MRIKLFCSFPAGSLVFLVLLGLLGSCSSKSEIGPPNIVWITSEDNSKHYMRLFDENGIATPQIEALAQKGIVFSRAFSNAPVCSVARSTIITGCYAPRIGAQFHRKILTVPMPEGLQMFPAYLRDAGYYTTNNSKEDYNLSKADDVWDESSRKASWKNRADGQPFFHVFNIGVSHEAGLHFTRELMDTTITATDPDSFDVQPNHPDTPIFRYTNARYRDKVQEMDRQLGEVIDALKADGQLDNTIVFYFGDHGGVLPGSKGYLYETGLHVPMVVHVPEKYQHLTELPAGSSSNAFVSFIDLAPTVLQLAGVKVPEGMDGKPFLGAGIGAEQLAARDESFGYADRFDEKYDQVRSVRQGKYKYIRNYQPFNIDGLMNNYRYKQLAYQEWQRQFEAGELNDRQAAFFKTKTPEMLFDLEADPYETRNLIDEPSHSAAAARLRQRLQQWVSGMPDLSFYPEHYLVAQAFDNPVAFGQAHKADIARYAAVADLALQDFAEAQGALTTYLASADPWERYWALIGCSSFGKQAASLAPTIKEMAATDPEIINRVRAAEYLGLSGLASPVPVMTAALYASQQPAEALLILNSIVLLQTKAHGYVFDLELPRIDPAVTADKEVQQRLLFLGLG